MKDIKKMVMDDDSVYFYGGMFSNFTFAPFTLNGVDFKTSEQALMYAKAKLFHDDEIAGQILKCSSPLEAKRLGRKVKQFDPVVWNEKCEKYMFLILRSKFQSHPELKKALLETCDRMIYEASPFDRVWGTGVSVDDMASGMKSRGENKLGMVLVKVREALK